MYLQLEIEGIVLSDSHKFIQTISDNLLWTTKWKNNKLPASLTN